ncbi:MAG: ornithine carbamoyltransferase [Candidatus Aenigmarchaeota archaeon]|nr:ornithine carbamoyltransferase [Candidatus Aenigmarchaeota archaeon]
MAQHLMSVKDLGKKGILQLLKHAEAIKRNPQKYNRALEDKTLFMLFETFSLRTRVSFEAGMTQLGGHAIFYHIKESTIGKEETIGDLARTISGYCDAIMVRVFSHEQLLELADYASVPVINGMTNLEHPCQILADMLTIYEKKQSLKIKLAYLGDGNNNTTHSLMYAAAILGMDIVVACPKGEAFEPQPAVTRDAKRLAEKSGSLMDVTQDASEAAQGADVVYTDSWMSYRIPEHESHKRMKLFLPYQVNKKTMSLAKKDAVFMHCLPAKRGNEVTEDVFESRQSIVFQQAENRLHMQKAILLWLMRKL